MNTPTSPKTARLRIRPAIMFFILLIGLPTLLHILLYVTRRNFGDLPAVVLTLVIGVVLSVVYAKQPEVPATEEASLVGA